MRNDSLRGEISNAVLGGGFTAADTLDSRRRSLQSFDLTDDRPPQRVFPRSWRPGRDDRSPNMVWTVELFLSEPTKASRPNQTPRRFRERPDATGGATPGTVRILVAGPVVAAVVSLVFDVPWGGVLLVASVFSALISVANQQGTARLADLHSRHGDGLMTRSEYATEKEHIIHPRIPDYWSVVG